MKQAGTATATSVAATEAAVTSHVLALSPGDGSRVTPYDTMIVYVVEPTLP
jgi:hypothetical protein